MVSLGLLCCIAALVLFAFKGLVNILPALFTTDSRTMPGRGGRVQKRQRRRMGAVTGQGKEMGNNGT